VDGGDAGTMQGPRCSGGARGSAVARAEMPRRVGSPRTPLRKVAVSVKCAALARLFPPSGSASTSAFFAAIRDELAATDGVTFGLSVGALEEPAARAPAS
jgi:hypothetical protein